MRGGQEDYLFKHGFVSDYNAGLEFGNWGVGI